MRSVVSVLNGLMPAGMSLLLSLAWVEPAAAADWVRLAEVLPELADTPAGETIVGAAPPAGEKRRFRRRELVKALRTAGLSPADFHLPKNVLVSRKARLLSAQRAQALVADMLSSELAPCQVSSVRVQGKVRVADGKLDLSLRRRPALRSGRLSVVVSIEGAGGLFRVPASARLECPRPAVKAGSIVSIAIHIGPVVATTTAKANQSGRVGEVIRATTVESGRALMARVLDEGHLEVVR